MTVGVPQVVEVRRVTVRLTGDDLAEFKIAPRVTLLVSVVTAEYRIADGLPLPATVTGYTTRGTYKSIHVDPGMLPLELARLVRDPGPAS
jgi:hypothetical protein